MLDVLLVADVVFMNVIFYNFNIKKSLFFGAFKGRQKI